MGASLYCLHVPSGFGRSAGSDVSSSHIFPQGVLAGIILVGGRAEDGGARAGARHELRLLLYSVANTTLLGVGVGLQLLEQKP